MIGFGKVAQAMVPELLALSYQITALSRTPQSIEGVKHHLFDLEDAPVVLNFLPRDFDLILFMLAPPRHPKSYYRVYETALPEVLRYFSKSSVILLSSSSAIHAKTPFSQSIRAGEDWVRRLANRYLILRSSGIYGEGRRTLIDWVKEKKPIKEGVSHRIHQKDLIAAILFLLNRLASGVLFDETLFISDPNPTLKSEIVDWIEKVFDLKGVIIDGAQQTPLLPTRLQALGFSWQYPSFKEGFSDA